MFKIFTNKGTLHEIAVFLTQGLISYLDGRDILFSYVARTNNSTTKNTDWYTSIYNRCKNYPIINLTSRSLPDA